MIILIAPTTNNDIQLFTVGHLAFGINISNLTHLLLLYSQSHVLEMKLKFNRIWKGFIELWTYRQVTIVRCAFVNVSKSNLIIVNIFKL